MALKSLSKMRDSDLPAGWSSSTQKNLIESVCIKTLIRTIEQNDLIEFAES